MAADMAAVSNKKHLSLSFPIETITFFSGTRPLRPPFRCHATQKLGNSNVYDNKAENPIKPKHDLFVVLAKCARFFFSFFHFWLYDDTFNVLVFLFLRQAYLTLYFITPDGPNISIILGVVTRCMFPVFAFTK